MRPRKPNPKLPTIVNSNLGFHPGAWYDQGGQTKSEPRSPETKGKNVYSWFWTNGIKQAAVQFAQMFDPRTPEGDVAILSTLASDPELPAINMEGIAIKQASEAQFGTKLDTTPYKRVVTGIKTPDIGEALRGTKIIATRAGGVQPTNILVQPITKRTNVVNRRNL